MTASSTSLIRAHCAPLQPRPTSMVARLQRMDGIRAVLFDIYGTLLISASGDIGTNASEVRLAAIEAMLAFRDGLDNTSPDALLGELETAIAQSHAAGRQHGRPYPEVDILDIWTGLLAGKVDSGAEFISDWALEFELRTNPVWPMPNSGKVLGRLASSPIVLGLVSNAQFYTPLLFPTLLGSSPEGFGIASELAIYSYRYGRGKPDSHLYELAKIELQRKGIKADETLMVGNDMLNDIAASHRVGFRTALFAGDERSLRLRSDDDRVAGVEPDLVINELPQLFDCLGGLG